MDEQLIITREAMRARGRKARAAGKGRDDHEMNWHAEGIKEWQAGWDAEDQRLRAEQLEAA
jgi:hypothetical protein